MKELKAKVAELEPGQFLAIHGMPGSGKSVLAAEVAHDPDVTLAVFLFVKMGQSPASYLFIFVFLNKHYNFYNK